MKKAPESEFVAEPLDPELRALLDDARAIGAVTPAYGTDARERVLARVNAVRQSADRSARSGVWAGRFRRGPVIALASLCLIGGLVGVQIRASSNVPLQPSTSSSPGSNAVTTVTTDADRPLASADVDGKHEPIPTLAVGNLPSSTPLGPRQAAPARPAVRVEAPPAPKGGLAEEYRLIESARAKLAAKDYAGALGALREHESRFPDGQLAQACERLHIQMLVETGRITEARERAQRFRARFPDGLLLPAVARALAEGDVDSARP
jgi:TolA-binding protein